MRRITSDLWRNVPAGTQVGTEYGYSLTAPKEPDGTYTLYRLVSEHDPQKTYGWEWERNRSETEDRQAIVTKLYHLLRRTRAGRDLVGLKYIEDPRDMEFVQLRWKDGSRKCVNVTCDSELALIKDVIRAIE